VTSDQFNIPSGPVFLGSTSDQSIDPAHHNQVGVTNPGLGPLADNGGPTPTIALLPSSPAIGMGSLALASAYSLTTDQRGAGFPRSINGTTVDIGAYESSVFGNPTVYMVNLTSDTGTPSGTDDVGGSFTLRVTCSGPSRRPTPIPIPPEVSSSSTSPHPRPSR
jgi:hypothetical protein